MLNDFEIYRLKSDSWRTANMCLRGVAHALPTLAMVYGFAYVMKTASAAPYTLTCQTVPTSKSVRAPVKFMEKPMPAMTPVEIQLPTSLTSPNVAE